MDTLIVPQATRGKHRAGTRESWVKDVAVCFPRLQSTEGDPQSLIDVKVGGSYYFTVKVAEGQAFLVGIDTPPGTGRVLLVRNGELNAEGLTRFLDQLADGLKEERSFWD